MDIELPPILRKSGASIPSWQTGPLLLCHQFVDEAPMLHGLLDCLPVVKNPCFVWLVCLFCSHTAKPTNLNDDQCWRKGTGQKVWFRIDEKLLLMVKVRLANVPVCPLAETRIEWDLSWIIHTHFPL